jgi:hypothetical protein
MVSGGHNRKPDGERVGRSGARNSAKSRTVPIGRAKGQPELPKEIDWPDQTMDWWEHWGSSALSNDFTTSDWDALLETATYHRIIWDMEAPVNARLKAGSEVRQRMALFGATPLDRQRLRIQLVFADEAEEKAEQASAARKAGSPTRQRRGPLKDASAS